MAAIAEDFAAELHEDMLLGFPMAPFILALRPDNFGQFAESLVNFSRKGSVT